MKSRAHRALGLAAGVAGGLLVLCAALHFALRHRFDRIVERTLVPAAERALGVDIEVRNPTLSLFGGRLALDGLSVANPPGFVEPHVLSLSAGTVRLRPWALLAGVLDVAETRVDGGRFTIVHDPRGRFNILEIQRAVERRSAAGADPRPGLPPVERPAAPRAGPTPVGVVLRDVSLRATIEYVDRFFTPEQSLRLALDTTVEARNIATHIPVRGGAWGIFRIRGHLAGNPRAFVTDLGGRLAPLTDPARPSFDVQGRIAAVDWQVIKPALGKVEMDCDTAEVRVSARCRDGVYEKPDSLITVVLTHPRPTGRLARKTKGYPLPNEITVLLPVGGTLSAPEVNAEDALLRSVLQNLAANADALLRALGGALLSAGESEAKHAPTNGAANAAADR